MLHLGYTTGQGKCRVVRCLYMNCEYDEDGILTSRSAKDQDRSAALFSSIINEGGVKSERRRSSGNHIRDSKELVLY